MTELSNYMAVTETRALLRQGLGIQPAARMATAMLGGDPQYVALQAAEAEICCATTRAVLAQAALRRRGITSLMESDDED
jgi:hypothetical protein